MEKNFIRIFAAFPAPQEILERYSVYIKEYQNISGVRWTRKENLHLTLFFIGEVKEINLLAILEKLKAIQDSWKTFELHFEKISFRGKAHAPGMIWAQFERSNEFAESAKRIHTAISEYMTIIPQHQDPIPHITLARIKKGADISNISTTGVSLTNKMLVEKMEIWKTVQTKDGVIYERVDM